MLFFFFFNDTATTEIYTLSLHDALPIWSAKKVKRAPVYSSTRIGSQSTPWLARRSMNGSSAATRNARWRRSEEHTSELQSQSNLVCRLLLEKKKKNTRSTTTTAYGATGS